MSINIDAELEKYRREFYSEDEDKDIAYFKKKATQIKHERELAETPDSPDIETIRKMIDLRPRKR